METDDPAAMAALLATASDLLRSSVQPGLEGEARLRAAMVANAMDLVARALAHPGTAWSEQTPLPADRSVAKRVRALRPLVAKRLQVTNPAYVNQVKTVAP